ncbi:MAG: hypothetical protein K2Q97_17815 [Burkholderiaceae bacterium]|nr:hypothetical protein [Burkholderiaceae bacterium]
MQQSVDIVNLFEQFGGQTVPYQELGRDQKHLVSAARWPLVSAVQEGAHGDIPSVASGLGLKNAPRSERPWGGSQVQPSEPTRPAQSEWLQQAASAVPTFEPAPAAHPAAQPEVRPAVVSSSMGPAALSPAHSGASSPLAGRSPLSGLATPRTQSASADPAVKPQGPLPQDLVSVFARLYEAAPPALKVQQLAPAWSPAKGAL